MTRKRRLRQKAMRALGRQIRESGAKLPHVLIPVTMVISSLAAGHVTGSTFALSHDAAEAEALQFQTLTTSQVLRFSSGRVQLLAHSGPDRVGSEVVRTFQIMNISDRHVSLSVELTGIPWAQATLSQNVLGPGETADIVVSGTPDQPGEYQGYLIVYGMGGFLELDMEFTVVVIPAPDPCRPDIPPALPAVDPDPPGPPEEEVEETESPEVIIGLHPDLLGLPGDVAVRPLPDPEPRDEVGLPDVQLDDERVNESADSEAGASIAKPDAAEPDAEPEVAEADPEPEAAEGGEESAAPDATSRPGAVQSPGRADPCGDDAGAPAPDPVNECVPHVEALPTEESTEVTEGSDECAAAAPPAEGEGVGSGDGETDGRTDEGEEPAPGSPGDESEDSEEAPEGFADGKSGGDESGGDESGDDQSGGDAGGDTSGGDDSDDGAGSDDDGAGSDDDGSGGDAEGDESAGDEDETAEPGGDDTGSEESGDESGAEDSGGEAGDGGSDAGGEPAGDADDADDAGAGGQTT
mgnify:CR=1 FL=1